MKKLIALMLCLIFMSACTHNGGKSSIVPQPHSSDDVITSPSDAVYSGEPSLTVTQSVAYLFPQLEGNELYVACELKNDSDCPCTVEFVIYNVEIGEKTVKVNAVPPAADYCAVFPGELFYSAAWTGEQVQENTEVKVVSVDVSIKKSDVTPIRIKADNLFTVRNYPSFVTLSGDLQSENNAQLNLMYAAFYDENDMLLGVWCFTEPTELVKGRAVHFTTHLEKLPIEDLEQKAKEIRLVGFGYNSN